ncbi:MAG: peptide-methionine (S)-S-oxide reductase MsrA [Acidimicrobiia bacterium]
MFNKKSEMISPDDAIAGRPEPIEPADTHFVNGSSIHLPFPEGHEVAYFAMGCFWGAERIFWQIPGVHTTAAGYMGGYTANPTYEEVCTTRTGHAEAVIVVYDPDVVSYEELLGPFWEQHDPTQGMRQGNDQGTQYRSAIYTTTDDQLAVAKRSRDAYQAKLTDGGFGTITTVIEEAGTFYYAEDYHQQYLAKNPGGYCNHGFCQVSYGS